MVCYSESSTCGELNVLTCCDYSCDDTSKTPPLCDRRFGDGGQGFEVLEGVDGVFGGEGGFEISGFGGVVELVWASFRWHCAR